MAIKSAAERMLELLDREAIRDGLMRYARGVDRCDEALLNSVYWPEASDDHGGFYRGSGSGFVEKALAYGREQVVKSNHFMGNVLIELKGELADVESYVVAHEVHRGANGLYDIFVGCRYVDRWQKRGEEWRILKRSVLFDWYRVMPETGDWDRVFPSQIDWNTIFNNPDNARSDLKPLDDSYRLMSAQEKS